ncbi:hypothetical protein OG579_10105 [Williamsia herbipolensis]|uniref:Uncharacterized protein n=1 Tax=Williamsia herbipolensis TaxID=1603258 RepID=A0AAU4K833_9NOCA|nr:hypothetical protein [Williamsia herbipolensis]
MSDVRDQSDHPGSPDDRRPAIRPSTAAGSRGDTSRGSEAPRPQRPQVAVTPMRAPVDDRRPRVIDLGIVVWVFTLVALAATAALVALDQGAARSELRRSLASDNPTTAQRDIANTVDIAMVAAGGVCVIVLLLVIYGSIRLRERVIGGRGTLTTMGVITVVGSIAFWTVLSPARDVLNPAVTFLPFVVAVLAAVATGLMFTGDVTRWLKAAPTR